MKITLTNLKKIYTLEQLKELDLGSPIYDIGERGGHLGFAGIHVANRIGVSSNYLPKNYGVYCNYLGGGIRGALTHSGFDDKISIRKKQLLEALADACKRVYNDIELELGLFDDTDADGETNWNNVATKKARESGTISGY
jgi:hypothetical protein